MTPLQSLWLVVRSLAWAVALPGLLAFYVPWRYFDLHRKILQVPSPVSILGLMLAATGAALLMVCIWEFAHSGRGTLSPVDPPHRLVVRGLYRYVRNPMYAGVTLVLAGELLLLRSAAFAFYALAWLGAVNAFVLLYEEPTLLRQFGLEYQVYRTVVPRWIPRFRGFRSSSEGGGSPRPGV